MGNPLDLKEFEHFLDFLSDNTGEIQISEPVKFDASEFVIEQDDKGYARDISYMADEISLEFYEGFFEPSPNEYQLESGIVVDKLGHAIDELLRYDKDYGHETHIVYKLKRNGTVFVLGELNFEGRETDEYTYFKCKVIQQTKRALARRREDVEIDGFATEDLDGNPITPIETVNFLLKAKPNTDVSEWVGNTGFFRVRNITSGSNSFYFNNINNVQKQSINNTLSFLPSTDPRDMVYIEALDDLTDVNIQVNINLEFKRYLGNIGTGNLKMQYFVGDASDITFDALNQVVGAFTIFQRNISNSDIETVNETFNFTAPNIPRGKRLFIWFFMRLSSTGVFGVETTFLEKQILKITGTSTAIDTVIKATRYIDLAKQSLRTINGMELVAPDHEEGGRFYNLFATSGNLIRQRDDVPFYFNFKDRRENLMLMNSDIQINEENAFCLKYSDFYSDVDNGAFEIDPSEESVSTYNDRYLVNVIEWAFKDYEKDRDEENTLDAVHTEAQWSVNNTRVKRTKKIDIKDIFDPSKIESARRQAFKETTALDGDDKIHCIDGIPIAPGTKGGFSALMQHNVDDDGNVQILKDADLPSWALLGFNIGSNFEILSGFNSGTYIVHEIENTILTLEPVSPPNQSDTGESYTQVEYPLENVLWTNRTNEGFDLIENLLNPDNFSNLKYTIRRSAEEWESYFSTCAEFISDDIKNTKFVNNGSLVTQFEGGDIYTENGDIVLDEISPAILTSRLYDVTVRAEYEDVLSLIQKYQNIDTVGGFIRVKFTNGDIKRIYPKRLGYTWSTKKLNIVGEEKVTNEFVVITKTNNIIKVNNVVYDTLNYELNDEFLALYDDNLIKIINFTKYDKFIVQEETFENPSDLVQAIIDL